MQLLELHIIKGKPLCARDVLHDGASRWRVSVQTSKGIKRWSQAEDLSDKAAAEALALCLLPSGPGACSREHARALVISALASGADQGLVSLHVAAIGWRTLLGRTMHLSAHGRRLQWYGSNQPVNVVVRV